MESEESAKQTTVNPIMLLALALLGGGITGGGTNLLIPSDAPDRYSGTMAAHDWESQKYTNNALRAKVERLEIKCLANEQTLGIIKFRFENGVFIPHEHTGTR